MTVDLDRLRRELRRLREMTPEDLASLERELRDAMQRAEHAALLRGIHTDPVPWLEPPLLPPVRLLTPAQRAALDV